MAEILIELSEPALQIRFSKSLPLLYLARVDAADFGLQEGEYRGTLTLVEDQGAESVWQDAAVWVHEPSQSVDGTTIPSQIAVGVPGFSLAGRVSRLALAVRISVRADGQ